jgi:protein PhnA
VNYAATENLKVYEVLPTKKVELAIMACSTCIDQIENPGNEDLNHWRCLNDSMWSEHTAVQVVSWRMLSRMRSAGWPQELIDQMYLDEDTLAYAQATGEGEEDENKVTIETATRYFRSGRFSGFNQRFESKRLEYSAKQGTAVRNIRLDHDNAEFIEGKVDGQTIVIITQYVKKL